MRGDDLPGRPIFRNTNEANSKILNEKQDPSLTEAGGGDGTQPHECQPNSRQHSLSVRSHTSAEISMQRGNSSIQIATAVSRNEDGTLLKNTAINTGEAFEDYNTSTMVVSEALKLCGFRVEILRRRDPSQWPSVLEKVRAGASARGLGYLR